MSPKTGSTCNGTCCGDIWTSPRIGSLEIRLSKIERTLISRRWYYLRGGVQHSTKISRSVSLGIEFWFQMSWYYLTLPNFRIQDTRTWISCKKLLLATFTRLLHCWHHHQVSSTATTTNVWTWASGTLLQHVKSLWNQKNGRFSWTSRNFPTALRCAGGGAVRKPRKMRTFCINTVVLYNF